MRGIISVVRIGSSARMITDDSQAGEAASDDGAPAPAVRPLHFKQLKHHAHLPHRLIGPSLRLIRPLPLPLPACIQLLPFLRPQLVRATQRLPNTAVLTILTQGTVFCMWHRVTSVAPCRLVVGPQALPITLSHTGGFRLRAYKLSASAASLSPSQSPLCRTRSVGISRSTTIGGPT
jgi:hypothetical protein